jgi:hypothetical protein
MADGIGGRESVMHLAIEDPQWLPAVRAAVTVADRTGNLFPGTWILAELQRENAPRTWYPNFRRLVTFSILEKHGESTRGGQRAYYRVRDLEGVRRGLSGVERRRARERRSAHRLSFAGIGRSGRSNLGRDSEDLLRSGFPSE